MRLKDHTDYALRVLMYLNKTKELTTLDDLSRQLNITRNNLIKVSNKLAKLKYITSARGPSGGIRIQDDTGKVTLGSIVRQIEDQIHLAECFSPGRIKKCTLIRGCRLKGFLSEAYEAFISSLDNRTLDDITP